MNNLFGIQTFKSVKMFCCLRPRRPSASSIRVACAKSNPFLNDLVIEVMVKEADVDTLKTLREINSIWNKLDLKELEKRALKGQLEELDFSSGCQKKINQFLKFTKAIPQLFHSFKLNFLISFKSKFPITFKSHPLLKKCTPNFLHLEFHKNIQWTELTTTSLRNLFSSNSSSLQELKIKKIEDFLIKKRIFFFKIPSANGDSPLVFPKLTKLTLDMGPDGSLLNEHFQFILDKSGAVDPTPNLTILEASINSEFLKMMSNEPTLSRWTQLTILRIQDHCEDYSKISATLLSLGKAGMGLKVLAMVLFIPVAEASPDFWGNWSQFFATQAKSLQVLELQGICDDDVYDIGGFMLSKIRLPKFEILHTLQIYLECDVYIPSGRVEPRIFEIGPFPDHFPKVVLMKVNEQGLLNIFPVEGEPISLKSLIIIGVPDNWEVWTSRIRSVESLKCKDTIFSDGEAKTPWKDSIKEFLLTPDSEEIEFPFYALY